MSAILVLVKELMGIPSDVSDFDTTLLLHINSALATLNQLGIETEQKVIEATDTMEDLLPEDEDAHNLVLTCLYLKTRLIFDPPQTSFVLDALTKLLNEQEWRLEEYASSKT